jgi:hypothetical protein
MRICYPVEKEQKKFDNKTINQALEMGQSKHPPFFQNCDFESLCKNKTVTGAVLRELISHGKRVGLEKWEMPGAVTICEVITAV